MYIIYDNWQGVAELLLLPLVVLLEFSCTAGRCYVIQTSQNVLFGVLCVGMLQEAHNVLMYYCYVSLVWPITRLTDPGSLFANVMHVVGHWNLTVHGDKLIHPELLQWAFLHRPTI